MFILCVCVCVCVVHLQNENGLFHITCQLHDKLHPLKSVSSVSVFPGSGVTFFFVTSVSRLAVIHTQHPF